jgi:putative two-component system response regulator
VKNKTTRRTILIVDDIAENISLLEAFLSQEYTILTASRGSEALEIARTCVPDLILLDIMMPEMNGYEVCRALKADSLTERIPVIFVTTSLDSDDETRSFEAGGTDFISKPIIGNVVRVRVKAHLALKAEQDELHEWNGNLKKRLLESIKTIRLKSEALMTAEERASGLSGYTMSIELLSVVFELMKDRFGVHSLAVSVLAGDAARQMQLTAKDVVKIRLAGLMHDVGKIGDRLQSHEEEKDERDMTYNELHAFHAHPERGENLIASFEELQDVALMVRSHHESYGGGGFPDNLQGDDIPLGARLIAIANFIEHAAKSVSENCAEYAIMKVRLHPDALLDPRLINYFTMITRTLYYNGKKSVPREVAVPSNELISGMRLSRDITNEVGMLLLQKGALLDSAGITLIRSNNRMNRLADGISVYVTT